MQFFKTLADAFSTLTLSDYLILFTTIFLVALTIFHANFKTWFKHFNLFQKMFLCGGLVFLFLVSIPILNSFRVALPTWMQKLVPGNLIVHVIAATVWVISAIVQFIWRGRHTKFLIKILVNGCKYHREEMEAAGINVDELKKKFKIN